MCRQVQTRLTVKSLPRLVAARTSTEDYSKTSTKNMNQVTEKGEQGYEKKVDRSLPVPHKNFTAASHISPFHHPGQFYQPTLLYFSGDESWDKVTCYCQKAFAGKILVSLTCFLAAFPTEKFDFALCMSTRWLRDTFP